MGGGIGPVIQPPETQNIFVCFSIVVGLLWVLNSSRRCWAVLQLRRALGSRRLVAIRGAGRRVRIFRLLGRNYLQRALARNHLQALVHTRQAYPPKTMPCSLLLASDPDASRGVKATLHPRDREESASPPGSPCPTGVHVVEGGVLGGAGTPVGVSLELDCRVACTVELLWDVDLAFLGREMGLHPKLKLLPEATGADSGATPLLNDTASAGRGNSTSSAATASGVGAIDGSNSGGGGRSGSEAGRLGAHGGTAGYPSYRDVWTSVRSLFPTVVGRGRGGGSRRGRRVAGVPHSSSEEEIPQWARGGADGGGVGGGGGNVDEEMGGPGGGSETGGGGINGNGSGGDGLSGNGINGSGNDANGIDANGNIADDAGSETVGRGGGGGVGEEGNASAVSSRNTGRSWTAALGLRKPAILANNASVQDQRAGGWGQSGDGGSSGGGSRDGGGFGSAGGALRCLPRTGGCGKRTVPRALPAGRRQLFETLPGESYFRVRQDDASSGDGGGSGGGAGARGGGGSMREGRGRRGGGVGRGGGGGGGGGWPRIEESASAGRCSLAIVVRPAVGAETGDWAGWRHRPTHRVTRQVLLVQLKERGSAGGGGGGGRSSSSSEQQPPQQAPSAQCLRHLVAISKGGVGEPEAVYSYAEVFGASDEAGGGTGPPGPLSPSAVGSLQATAGVGSSSTIGAASSTPPQALSTVGGSGGGGMGGEEAAEECVICLTDPKSTVLLPCRHLCVCADCFRHVDKCPVCRSAFDNYIVLSGPAQPEGGGASAEGSAIGASAGSAAAAAGGGAGAGASTSVPPAGYASTTTTARAIGPRRVAVVASSGRAGGVGGAAGESGFLAGAVGAASLEGTVGGGSRDRSGLRADRPAEASGVAPARRDIFAVSRVRLAEREE